MNPIDLTPTLEHFSKKESPAATEPPVEPLDLRIEATGDARELTQSDLDEVARAIYWVRPSAKFAVLILDAGDGKAPLSIKLRFGA